jgi:uncharacterized protein YbgA (DUF1722 family)/uncharacterized protein YbbK (DUF523 family)
MTDPARPFVHRAFPTPRVVMSACLELEACRHDGHRIADAFIERLMSHVDLVPICPEVEIGLGVPREPVRLVADGERTHLVQPASGRDLSEPMRAFAARFLERLGPVDGFILKSGSPSCAVQDARVYASAERGSARVRTEPGLFAAEVLGEHDSLAVESDGRLRNYPIRHHFLTRLYALTELRELGHTSQAAGLADFQRRHKHLLMTYDQQKMRQLGAIAARSGGLSAEQAFDAYIPLFRQALAQMPRHAAYVNSLTHMYGHFKTRLSSAETHEFLSMLDEYAHNRLPLHALLAVVRAWCSRFEYAYFADQSLLEPYPRALIQMRDSGKGVDF